MKSVIFSSTGSRLWSDPETLDEIWNNETDCIELLFRIATCFRVYDFYTTSIVDSEQHYHLTQEGDVYFDDFLALAALSNLSE